MTTPPADAAPPGAVPDDPEAEYFRRRREQEERERKERSATAGADQPPRNGGPEGPGAAETRAAVLAAEAVTDPAAAARLRALRDEQDAAGLQAAIEGVVAGDRVCLNGAWFRISDRIGLMPLMKFAYSADEGLDTSDMKAMAALYAMLKDSIYGGTEADPDPAVARLKPGDKGYDAGDWIKFEGHAMRTKAQGEELMAVVSQVIEILSSRPTQ